MPVPTMWSQLSQTAANNSPPGSETVGPLANDYFQAAFSFIRQLYDGLMMPINPVNANGQKVVNVANGTALTDAVNVGQLNTTLGAPSGTRVVFQQAAAPTGWYVDTNTAYSDCCVRFNNTGISSGGSTAWSAWNFGGTFTNNAHALTIAEMPSHAHSDNGHGHNYTDNGHNHPLHDNGHIHGQAGNTAYQPASNGLSGRTYSSGDGPLTGNQGGQTANTNNGGTGIWIDPAGINIGINTGYASIAANGGNAGHTHTITTPQCKYADVLVCVKS